MGATVDTVAMIRDLVPERSELVERTYRADPSFRSLCNDYRACRDTLERLSRLDSPEAARRQSEYARLLDELSAEIRAWPSDRAGQR